MQFITIFDVWPYILILKIGWHRIYLKVSAHVLLNLLNNWKENIEGFTKLLISYANNFDKCNDIKEA